MNNRLADRIACQIAEYMRAENLAAGYHLATPFLADRFRVSRAPVTVALKALAEEACRGAPEPRPFS